MKTRKRLHIIREEGVLPQGMEDLLDEFDGVVNGGFEELLLAQLLGALAFTYKVLLRRRDADVLASKQLAEASSTLDHILTEGMALTEGKQGDYETCRHRIAGYGGSAKIWLHVLTKSDAALSEGLDYAAIRKRRARWERHGESTTVTVSTKVQEYLAKIAIRDKVTYNDILEHVLSKA